MLYQTLYILLIWLSLWDTHRELKSIRKARHFLGKTIVADQTLGEMKDFSPDSLGQWRSEAETIQQWTQQGLNKRNLRWPLTRDTFTPPISTILCTVWVDIPFIFRALLFFWALDLWISSSIWASTFCPLPGWNMHVILAWSPGKRKKPRIGRS